VALALAGEHKLKVLTCHAELLGRGADAANSQPSALRFLVVTCGHCLIVPFVPFSSTLN
jgi:hypothetical protein